jgi:nicotinamide-nucleotide amidase
MILLPGVPMEMKKLFEIRVMPELKKRTEGEIITEVLHLYGISEAKVDEVLSDLMKKGKNPSIAPYAGGGEVELHITARAENLFQAKALCSKAKEKVLSLLGEFCYGQGDTNLEKELVKALLQKGKTIATAESCTGGLVSQRITSVSGASEVIELGVCTYSERIKKSVVSVSGDTLETKGVYSKECALEMARGVRALAGSDLGLGITGVAGPSGGTENCPVGTVFIAVCDQDSEEVIEARFGDANTERNQIRARAASRALSMARVFLIRKNEKD